jgi:hypothetical protein
MAAIGMGGAKVVGLNEFRRELKRLDDQGLTKELKDANFEAAQSIIKPAQSLAASLGPMQAKAAATMKASRAASKAAVNLGGASAPFAGGAEFGSGRETMRYPPGRPGGVIGWNQFLPWRGNGGDAGYFLYPTIRDRIDELIEMYGDALERISAKAFPD